MKGMGGFDVSGLDSSGQRRQNRKRQDRGRSRAKPGEGIGVESAQAALGIADRTVKRSDLEMTEL
jgi:hypothetical protein